MYVNRNSLVTRRQLQRAVTADCDGVLANVFVLWEQEMTDLPPPIRRIVTGHDAQDRSCIIEDGPSPAVRLVPERPGYRVTNIWRTVGNPAEINATDSIAAHQGVAPP